MNIAVPAVFRHISDKSTSANTYNTVDLPLTISTSIPYPSSVATRHNITRSVLLHSLRSKAPFTVSNSFLFPMMAAVASARYGKDNVRVYKVHRDETTGIQTVTEMTVCVLLEGDIAIS